MDNQIFGWIITVGAILITIPVMYYEVKRENNRDKELRKLLFRERANFTKDRALLMEILHRKGNALSEAIERAAFESEVIEKIYLEMRHSDIWCKYIRQHGEQSKRRLLRLYVDVFPEKLLNCVSNE